MSEEDGYLYLLRYIFGGQLKNDAFILEPEALLISNVINSLTPREAFVIKSRYLNKETLKDIANKLPRCRSREDNTILPEGSPELLGVSRERVRQIEAKALRKLRHPTRSRSIMPIVERIFLPENKNV